MPPPAPPKYEEEAEDWLTTYADAITLLMAFFVMLLSFSKIDIALYEKVAAGIAQEIGGTNVETPVERLKVDMQDIVYGMDADEVVKVGTDDKGVVIEMDSSAFYKPGSAEIRKEAIPLLPDGINRYMLKVKKFNNIGIGNDYSAIVIENSHCGGAVCITV